MYFNVSLRSVDEGLNVSEEHVAKTISTYSQLKQKIKTKETKSTCGTCEDNRLPAFPHFLAQPLRGVTV